MTPDPPALRLEPGVESALAPFLRAVDGSKPRRATRARLLAEDERLIARFECEGGRPRASLVEHDAPLWREEVVEVFLAPASATPTRYFELEVNPLGTVFDAVVDSPHGDRRGLRVDTDWHCADLEVAVEIDAVADRWRAMLALPWRSMVPRGPVPVGWRLNLFRIARQQGSPPEYSAWSPTGCRPADFHRPERFGYVTRIV